MKKIKFSCSNCDAKLRVPTHLAGVSAPCPKCGHTITAPMEIDSAVEESAAPRQRPTNRAAGAGRPRSVQSGDTGASTAVAEAPPATERPRRETPSQQPESTPKSLRSDPAPSDIEKEPSDEPIVTETFLKPKAKTSLPAPVLPEPTEEVEDVEESPPVFPETLASSPSAIPASETPPSYEPPPIDDSLAETTAEEIGSDASLLDIPPMPAEEEAGPPEISEPPAVAKTQPIRTIERPSDLPPIHSAPESVTSDLPRLDISLAGDGSSASPQGKVSEKAVTQGKTKLRLPSPGEQSKRFTPADFIAPESHDEPVTSESVPTFPDATAHPEPATVDSDESYTILDPDESTSAPDFDPVPLDSLEELDEPEAPPFAPAEKKSLDDLVVEEESPALTTWDPIAEPELEQEEAPARLPAEDPVEGDLDEGTFEKLFAQQSAEQSSVEPFPNVGPEFGDSVNAPHFVDSQGHAPSSGQATSSQLSHVDAQPVLRKETRGGGDVLEEMFGSSKSVPLRPKKSTLILLGVFALLATIAIAIVVVAGSALGFWGETPTTMDPVTKAPESMKPKEESPEVVETKSGTESRPSESAPDREGVPAAIDPGEAENSESADEAEAQEVVGSTLSLPGDTETPVRIMDSSGRADTTLPPASLQSSSETPGANAEAMKEPEALSFDERVQNIVNGNGLNTDSAESMPESLSTPPPNSSESGNFAAAGAAANAPAEVENYNPPESFEAPGPDDGPLGKTHDLIDAFLRAPDWKTRAKYVYQAESLMPTMEEYYKKWPDRRLDRYSHQLYAMESDVEFGGPYWVYLISQSDNDEGYPFIIRVEDGKLKVDWESHSEFFDQHWVKFQQGGIAVPHTFRVAIERVSDYYGPDRDQFENLDDYFVYKINPPYGGDDEFMEYAFVKKDSNLAAELDKDAGLGEEALAVMLTLDYEQFSHGEKHLVIKDYVSEGWFR